MNKIILFICIATFVAVAVQGDGSAKRLTKKAVHRPLAVKKALVTKPSLVKKAHHHIQRASSYKIVGRILAKRAHKATGLKKAAMKKRANGVKNMGKTQVKKAAKVIKKIIKKPQAGKKMAKLTKRVLTTAPGTKKAQVLSKALKIATKKK